MPRNVPPDLAQHIKSAATTTCRLLQIVPKRAPAFGITTLNRDVEYDDGTLALTYRAKRGYTASDTVTKSDLSVNNAEAQGLMAQYPLDGVTMEGIARGEYDGARYVQYLVNYEDTSMGHVIISSGTIGQIKQVDDLACLIELRELTQVLKQNSIIELTSITCRARFGDAQCKMPLIWYDAEVIAVGDETDRNFTLGVPQRPSDADSDWPSDFSDISSEESSAMDSSGSYDFPSDFFVPGIIKWVTGDNAEIEYEVESYDGDTGEVVLVIPTYSPIKVGDLFRIRRDCPKSKQACIDYGNILNFRGEPELPRADGSDLQSPTRSA